MEYVKIVYPSRRQVNIDGEDNGFTNSVLRCDTGTHVFDLDDPKDYEPGSCERVVQNTTVLRPMEIIFSPKG
jgi:hypothetical protein